MASYAVTFILLFIAQVFADTPLQLIAETNAKFSRDYFKALKSMEGNLVASPLSAQLALAMTQLGTGGNTASVMSSALHLPLDRTTSNAGFKELGLTLKVENTEDVNIKIANRMYIQTGFPVKQDFIRTATESFDSQPQSVDLNNPNTRVSINQWVEQVTGNKIKDLIQEGVLTPDTRVVLVNAMYFYGKWFYQFTTSSTTKKRFFTTQTNAIQVAMMENDNYYKYAELEDLDAKLVEIQYQGRKTSMVILLPNSRTGLSELETKMQSQNLSSLINTATYQSIKLMIPKFKIETSIDLKQPLIKMGMGEIFENTADFSGMSSARMKVAKAVQKTVIQVAEGGTEAASSAYVSVMWRSARLIPSSRMEIDHPFLFYVVHRTTDSNHVVLFSGRVLEPPVYTN